jgi:hypothetical protein
MNKNSKFAWLLLPIMWFSLVACGDTNTTEEVEPISPKEAMLIAKKWKMIAQSRTVKLGTVEATTSFYEYYPACVQDNLDVYASTKTYSIEEGATKCDSDSPQSQQVGTWSLMDNESKLKIMDIDGESIITIKELSATVLKVVDVQTETLPSGMVETTTIETTYQGQN